ncbi:MAG: HD domain-containing protein [Candidatus Abyssobacteria bacterium SURF_17]|uniref:HD domain-containing protein n=1 Tax=Candidatus Abyssobacteria bacterium SURF_17 TaxID=2093361 RepID=A0A419EYL6_9BACT|nr:MAG: HD domain-containing protein [Candidatus Abyssubacteria bacterium SURF_17]
MDSVLTEYTIPPEIMRVFEAFEREGIHVYLVGGTVREIVRGAADELIDFDFATPTSAEETARILRKAGLRPIPLGMQFGTVGTIIENRKVDITTFRRGEEYKPRSRHPEVDFGGTIEEDLQRRDFCMNAIAMTKSGEVIDPYNGLEDIRNKRITVPGEAEKLFSDDPLRLLRAARFVSQLGYAVVPSLKKTARKMAFLITTVSRERWKMEMDKLLMGEDVHRGLDYLLDSDLLTFMMPEVTVLKGFNQTDEYHHKDVWEHTKRALRASVKQIDVRWALLFHDLGKPYTKSIQDGHVHFYHHEVVGETLARSIMFRLRFSNEQRKKVSSLIFNHMRPNMYDDDWNDSAVRRLARDMRGHVFDLINLSRADITSMRPETVRRGLSRLDKLQARVENVLVEDAKQPPLPKGMGNAIMEQFGIGEGPQVGIYMKRLLEAVEEGRLETGREYDYYLQFLNESER